MKLIVGNWKLNPSTLNDAVALASSISYSIGNESFDRMILLPPFIFLEELAKRFKQISWGAQDFFWESKGAYTGEVSLPMLKDIGVNWVLVGHSERRRIFGETDEMVNKKMKFALENNFKTIVAVGELNRGDYPEEIIQGFKKSVADADKSKLENLIIAYEPVWAIGTGESDDPARSNSIIGQLKTTAFKMFGEDSNKIKFLYGGSVNSQNSKSFLNQKNIDGALIGGASLISEEFASIVESLE